MKKTLRLLFLLSLLCAVLVLAASAVESPAVSDVATGANVAFTDANYNKLNVTYNGSDLDGDFYVVLVVKGTAESHPISGSSILYIDLVEKDAVNGVVFTADDDPVKSNPVYPKSVSDSVVLLGGDFGEGTSPKVIATIDVPGYKVSGNAQLGLETNWWEGSSKAGTFVTLSLKSDSNVVYTAETQTDGTYELTGVPDGVYTLTFGRLAFLPHRVTTVTIDGENISVNVKLTPGDVETVKSPGAVTGDDLSYFLSQFGSSGALSSDLNGDYAVEGADLSKFLSSFGLTTTVE